MERLLSKVKNDENNTKPFTSAEILPANSDTTEMNAVASYIVFEVTQGISIKFGYRQSNSDDIRILIWDRVQYYWNVQQLKELYTKPINRIILRREVG